MNLQILVFSLLIMFVKTQEITGSGFDQETSGDYSSSSQEITTMIPIFNASATVTNIISIIPNNNTVLQTTNNSTLITIFPTTNTTSCLSMWQKVQILFNFASFDVNQYLNCLTNAARFTPQNNIFTIIALLIATLMNN
jgi:hypothetical protein